MSTGRIGRRLYGVWVVVIALIAAGAILASSSKADASTGRISHGAAVAKFADFMKANCSDGFDWACVDDAYSPARCFAAGKHSWYCHGVVREGTPDRLVTITARLQGHRIATSHKWPTKRLGADVVES